MLHVKNIKKGSPKNEDQAHLVSAYNVTLLFDEEGVNWYDTVKKFSSNTYKILYDSTGCIFQIEYDASRLSPFDGSNVLEVREGDEVKNLRNKIYSLEKDVICWKVQDGCLVFSPNEQDIKFLKNKELEWLKGQVETYKTREVLNLLSAEEELYLNALFDYAKLVDKCSSSSDLQALSRPTL